MPVLRSLGPRAVLLGAVGSLFSCATRDVPARYPASSAASQHAAAPRPPTVATSLEGDLPFVEEANDGAAPPARDHGAHHHGH